MTTVFFTSLFCAIMSALLCDSTALFVIPGIVSAIGFCYFIVKAGGIQ